MKLPLPTAADLRRAKEFLGEENETSLLLAQWAAEERRRVINILSSMRLINCPACWEVADYLREETDAEI